MFQWRARVLKEGVFFGEAMFVPGALRLKSERIPLMEVDAHGQTDIGVVDSIWREGLQLMAEGRSHRPVDEGWVPSVSYKARDVRAIEVEGFDLPRLIVGATIIWMTVGHAPHRIFPNARIWQV